MAAGLIGCAQGTASGASDSGSSFKSAVAKADAAWSAGDAETAFTLYTTALKLPDAKDPDGSVAAKQDKAKRLMLSRRILAKSEPSPESISSYVQVLQDSSPDSTEAAAARAGLAACLTPYPKEMRAEVAQLRKRIKAGKSVEMPSTIFLVSKLADGWRTEVAQAPGSVGVHAAAAADKLSAAAKAVDKAFGRTYMEDALKDLAAADKALDAADGELEEVADGK